MLGIHWSHKSDGSNHQAMGCMFEKALKKKNSDIFHINWSKIYAPSTAISVLPVLLKLLFQFKVISTTSFTYQLLLVMYILPLTTASDYIDFTFKLVFQWLNPLSGSSSLHFLHSETFVVKAWKGQNAWGSQRSCDLASKLPLKNAGWKGRKTLWLPKIGVLRSKVSFFSQEKTRVVTTEGYGVSTNFDESRNFWDALLSHRPSESFTAGWINGWNLKMPGFQVRILFSQVSFGDVQVEIIDPNSSHVSWMIMNYLHLWFQPLRNMCVKLESFPQIDSNRNEHFEKEKLWNRKPVVIRWKETGCKDFFFGSIQYRIYRQFCEHPRTLANPHGKVLFCAPKKHHYFYPQRLVGFHA